MSRLDCALQLRSEGYVHTFANRYAKLLGKRRMAYAEIIEEEGGRHRIKYL